MHFCITFKVTPPRSRGKREMERSQVTRQTRMSLFDPEQAFLLALRFLRAGQIQSYGLRMRQKRLKFQAEAAIDREGLARRNHIRVRQIGGELA